MRVIAGMLLGLVAAGLAGLAQSAPETSERNLDENEIRELTSGKTFHYTLLNAPRGEEQHYEDGRVTWMLPDGECMHGVWIVKEEILCYFYGLDRYGCWNVVANTHDGRTSFRHSPVDLDGSSNDSPSVYINRISEEPVSCTPPQLVLFSPPR